MHLCRECGAPTTSGCVFCRVPYCSGACGRAGHAANGTVPGECAAPRTPKRKADEIEESSSDEDSPNEEMNVEQQNAEPVIEGTPAHVEMLAAIAAGRSPPVLGHEGTIMKLVHNSEREIWVQGKRWPPSTVYYVREWARVPFDEYKKDYEERTGNSLNIELGSTKIVYINRNGVRIRKWIDGRIKNLWKETSGKYAVHDKLHGIQEHFVSVNYHSYKFARLVLFSFFGTPPNIESSNALHVHRCEEGKIPDDSFFNLYWGTALENINDRFDDNPVGKKHGAEIAIYGRHIDSTLLTVAFLSKNGIIMPASGMRMSDGMFWQIFPSLADAEFNTGASGPSIYKIASGKNGLKTAKQWTFQFCSVARPDEKDLRFLDQSRRGKRFITSDAKLLLEKQNHNGETIFVELIMSPTPRTGRIVICTSHMEISAAGVQEKSPIYGYTARSRIVAYLFLKDQIDAKLAANPGLTFSNLDVDHIIPRPLTNDSISNLEVLTRNEHAQKTNAYAVEERQTSDPTSVLIKKWLSLSLAAKEVGVSETTIGISCHQNIGIKGRGKKIERFFHFTK